MSEAWPFHDKTQIYYVWGLIISWQNTLILCFVLDHLMTIHTATMSEAWTFHDKQTDAMYGDWPFHDKASKLYIWGLTNSWQNRLILYMGLDHFMTKQTDTMSGARSFHNKTDKYYVWGLTISCQNQLILFVGLDHFMTTHTDNMSGAWPFHNICVTCLKQCWCRNKIYYSISFIYYLLDNSWLSYMCLYHLQDKTKNLKRVYLIQTNKKQIPVH